VTEHANEGFPWDVLLAVVGIVVPAVAFLWEFVLVGRKRLGYRVQMDTLTASERGFAPTADALAQLQHENGDRLVDPSFVLLRIENNGTTDIDTDDYAVNENDRAGRRFPALPDQPGRQGHRPVPRAPALRGTREPGPLPSRYVKASFPTLKVTLKVVKEAFTERTSVLGWLQGDDGGLRLAAGCPVLDLVALLGADERETDRAVRGDRGGVGVLAGDRDHVEFVLVAVGEPQGHGGPVRKQGAVASAVLELRGDVGDAPVEIRGGFRAVEHLRLIGRVTGPLLLADERRHRVALRPKIGEFLFQLTARGRAETVVP
jgi:hypothetical protein